MLSVTPTVFIFFIQALHTDSCHVVDVHLVFCAVLIYILSYSLDVELRYIVSPNRYINKQSGIWRRRSRAGFCLDSEYE